MKKFFQTGNAFFAVAALFLIDSFLTGNYGVYLSVALVFFILGIGVRKKNAQKSGETTTK